jgi:hypothetical protein
LRGEGERCNARDLTSFCTGESGGWVVRETDRAQHDATDWTKTVPKD